MNLRRESVISVEAAGLWFFLHHQNREEWAPLSEKAVKCAVPQTGAEERMLTQTGWPGTPFPRTARGAPAGSVRVLGFLA